MKNPNNSKRPRVRLSFVASFGRNAFFAIVLFSASVSGVLTFPNRRFQDFRFFGSNILQIKMVLDGFVECVFVSSPSLLNIANVCPYLQ